MAGVKVATYSGATATVEEAALEELSMVLAEVKTKYDPTNLFRMNQNIKPLANQCRGDSS